MATSRSLYRSNILSLLKAIPKEATDRLDVKFIVKISKKYKVARKLNLIYSESQTEGLFFFKFQIAHMCNRILISP